MAKATREDREKELMEKVNERMSRKEIQKSYSNLQKVAEKAKLVMAVTVELDREFGKKKT